MKIQLTLMYVSRRYYSGPTNQNIDYYLHVGEPFVLQIFNSYDPFKQFLEGVKEYVSEDLILYIKNFISKVQLKTKGQDKVLLFKSEYWDTNKVYNMYSEIPYEKYISLTSNEHDNVRTECLPKNN
jgi:hypothetical protein